MIRVRRGTCQNAVTLVEVVIASTISMMLMVVLWSMFAGGVRQFGVTQRHLEAVQVAQIVMEFVENDLMALIVDDVARETFFDSPSPLSEISFHVSRSDQAEGGLYVGEHVSYGIETVPGQSYGYFQRNGRSFSNMPLKSLVFEHFVEDWVADPARPNTQCFVRTTVTALDSSGRTEFTLVGLIAVDAVALRRRAPRWNPIPLQTVRLEAAP